MKKGAAPVMVGVFVIFSLALISGFFFKDYLSKSEFIVRTIREIEIIRKINTVEFTKRSLSNALSYSFYQASYLVINRGGYYDLSSVDSYDCIPYWMMYDSKMNPNEDEFIKNLEKATLKYLNEYSDALSDEVSVPSYDNIKIEKILDRVKLEANSKDSLEMIDEELKIQDTPTIKKEIKTKTLKLFKIGKEKFIDNDLIRSSSTYSDALNKLNTFNEITLDRIKIEVKPEENLGPSNSDFAFKTLVTITDLSNKYPAYDYQEKYTDSRNLQLRFYILSGTFDLVKDFLIINKCDIKP